MAVSTVCSCGRTLKAKDDWAGRKATCPQCGQSVTIPRIEETSPTPQKKAGGDSLFLVVVASIGLLVLVGGLFLAKTTIDSRKRAEANTKLHDSLTGAIQAANQAILKKDFTGAANGLRQVVQPKPAIEPGSENEKLLAEAEATLKASEIAATDAKTNEYLASLDDASLAAVRQGRVEATSLITDGAVKSALDSRIKRLVPREMGRREELARLKREQELATDFTYQKNLMWTWLEREINSIQEEDVRFREEILSMDSNYVLKEMRSDLTRRGIEIVLDKWGAERETMLAARTETIGAMVQEMSQRAMMFTVWKIGSTEEQMTLAETFGSKLKAMVESLEAPVSNQMASFESSFGTKAERGVRQLDELNAKMRATTQLYGDMFNGRLSRPR